MKIRICLTLYCMMFLATTCIHSNPLPIGGNVVGGSAAISVTPDGGTMNISQFSQNTSINFDSYNIGAANTVNYFQPNASSVALNRVAGQDPTQILGALNANGIVYLINPNGIVFGESARVNVNGLIAASFMDDTIDLDNKEALLERASGNVVNNGNIVADAFAILSGQEVVNTGSITSAHTALLAGDTLHIDNFGGAPVFLTYDNSNPVDDPLFPRYRVENSGTIKSNAGAITIHGEKLTISGEIDVSGENGGEVDIEGTEIELDDMDLFANGMSNGGNVSILGYDSDNSIASSIYTNSNSFIDVSSTESGDGGTVIIKAESAVVFYGKVKATGGESQGDGGFVEVSGTQYLEFNGNVDLRASNGKFGTLLLDPNNIIIQASGGDTNIDTNTGTFSTTADSSILSSTTIFDQLELGNLIIRTGTGGMNLEAGNITIDATITAPANNSSLTLEAHNDIVVNADIDFSASSGDVMLKADGIDSNDIGAISGTGKIILDSGGLFLSAASGIGTSVQQPINTETSKVDIVNTTSGDVFISNEGALVLIDLNIDGFSLSSTGEADITSDDRLIVNNPISNTGSLTLTSGSQLDIDADISAENISIKGSNDHLIRVSGVSLASDRKVFLSNVDRGTLTQDKDNLDDFTISDTLMSVFENNSITLNEQTKVDVVIEGNQWEIINGNAVYLLQVEQDNQSNNIIKIYEKFGSVEFANRPVLLDIGNTSISAGKTINIKGSIESETQQDLRLESTNISVNSIGGNDNMLGSFEALGNLKVSGDIITLGRQDYGRSLQIENNTISLKSSSNVTLNGAIFSFTNEKISLEANKIFFNTAGKVILSNIGAGELNVKSIGNFPEIAIQGNIITNGNQIYEGVVNISTFRSPDFTIESGSGDITFNQDVEVNIDRPGTGEDDMLKIVMKTAANGHVHFLGGSTLEIKNKSIELVNPIEIDISSNINIDGEISVNSPASKVDLKINGEVNFQKELNVQSDNGEIIFNSQIVASKTGAVLSIIGEKLILNGAVGKKNNNIELISINVNSLDVENDLVSQGDIVIRSLDPSLSWNLGVGTSQSDKLELSAEELSGISTGIGGVLRIGTEAAETGSISGIVNIPLSIENISLSANNISSDDKSGLTLVGDLALRTSGNIDLGSRNNNFSILAADSSTGDITIGDIDGFIIGAVDQIEGLSANRIIAILGGEPITIRGVNVKTTNGFFGQIDMGLSPLRIENGPVILEIGLSGESGSGEILVGGMITSSTNQDLTVGQNLSKFDAQVNSEKRPQMNVVVNGGVNNIGNFAVSSNIQIGGDVMTKDSQEYKGEVVLLSNVKFNSNNSDIIFHKSIVSTLGRVAIAANNIVINGDIEILQNIAIETDQTISIENKLTTNGSIMIKAADMEFGVNSEIEAQDLITLLSSNNMDSWILGGVGNENNDANVLELTNQELGKLRFNGNGNVREILIGNQDTGNITIKSQIDINPENKVKGLTLSAAEITDGELGSISFAGNLSLNTSGDIRLDSMHNDVNTLSIKTTDLNGQITFRDIDNLTIVKGTEEFKGGMLSLYIGGDLNHNGSSAVGKFDKVNLTVGGKIGTTRTAFKIDANNLELASTRNPANNNIDETVWTNLNGKIDNVTFDSIQSLLPGTVIVNNRVLFSPNRIGQTLARQDSEFERDVHEYTHFGKFQPTLFLEDFVTSRKSSNANLPEDIDAFVQIRKPDDWPVILDDTEDVKNQKK